MSLKKETPKAPVVQKKGNFWDKFVGFMCCTGRDKKSDDLQRKVIKESLDKSMTSQKSRLRRDDDSKIHDSRVNDSKVNDSKVGKGILKNPEAKKRIPNGVTTNGH